MTAVDERVEELVVRFGAPDVCLVEVLCDGHDPDRGAFALIREDFSTRTLTYGELRVLSEQIAAGLAELGVSADDSVAS